MIRGVVGPDGLPRIKLPVGERDWPALIDTGFNGDLELPFALGPAVQARYEGSVDSVVADGRRVLEDSYRVLFPFDGQVMAAVATFAQVDEILVGTRLLRNHRLEIRFVERDVLIEREVDRSLETEKDEDSSADGETHASR
jgi:predicted aspartyl protease